MAIIAKFKPKGPFPAVDAYYHLATSALVRRGNGAAELHFDLYASKAARDAFKAHGAELKALDEQIMTKQAQRSTPSVANDPTAAQQVEVEILQLQIDRRNLVKANEENQPLDDALIVQIGPDKLADILTDGNLDNAKAYTLAQGLPQLVDARKAD